MKVKAILITLALAIVVVAYPCLAEVPLVETYITSETVVRNHQLIEDRITAFQIIGPDSIADPYIMMEFARRRMEESIARMVELGSLTPGEVAGAIAASRREAREFRKFIEKVAPPSVWH